MATRQKTVTVPHRHLGTLELLELLKRSYVERLTDIQRHHQETVDRLGKEHRERMDALSAEGNEAYVRGLDSLLEALYETRPEGARFKVDAARSTISLAYEEDEETEERVEEDTET